MNMNLRDRFPGAGRSSAASWPVTDAVSAAASLTDASSPRPSSSRPGLSSMRIG